MAGTVNDMGVGNMGKACWEHDMGVGNIERWRTACLSASEVVQRWFRGGSEVVQRWFRGGSEVVQR